MEISFVFPGKRGFVLSPEISEGKWKKSNSEPTSVLDTHRSPSPTSTSTLSSSNSGGSGGGNQLQKWPSACETVEEEWSVELVGKYEAGMDEWENAMIQSIATPEPHDNSLLRWMLGEIEDTSKPNQGSVPIDGSVENGLPIDPATLDFSSGLVDSSCNGGVSFPFMGGVSVGVSAVSKCNRWSIPVAGNGSNGNTVLTTEPTNPSLPVTLSPGNFYAQQQPEATLVVEKPQLYPLSNLLARNSGLFLPEVPPAKRHHPGEDPAWSARGLQRNPHSNKVQFDDSGQNSFLRQPQKSPKPFPPDPFQDEAAHEATVDQLLRAAELVEAGNSVHAMAILARLNYQLPSPIGKPLYRAAFYFKEALLRLSSAQPAQTIPYSPKDVVLRIGAYKAFCEISPLVQFTSFTCNQAVLESVPVASATIHVLDFDIGIGGHWSSFMQEIAPKVGGGAHYSFKITALTSPCAHDQLELELTGESLSIFASSLGIDFEFRALNLDSCDLSVHNLCNSNEVLIVNLPASARRLFPSMSMLAILQFVKQLSPRIVVSVDYACDRTDLSFSQHFFHGLQFYASLFDSLNAMNVNSGTLGKVESLLMKPKIDSMVSSRYISPEKLPPFRNLFGSVGFKPVSFSNYTETQAECLIKRFNLRGFNVEKHQSWLVLLWHGRRLMSASIWTC